MNFRSILLPLVYKLHKDIFRSSYLNFVNLLEPNIINIRKKAFGKSGDGSYVLPLDLLSNEFVLLSFGVADDISFEESFLASYPSSVVYTFDPSISNLPLTKSNINFDMIGLGGKNNKKRNYVTLDSIVQRKNLQNQKIILKMDIEGWEWEVLYNTKLNNYDIPIIVAEFHVMTINTIRELLSFPIQFIKRYKAIKKLKDDYYCFHIHANNYNYTAFKSFLFPWCFEMTFVKKTIFFGQVKDDIDKYNSINCPDRVDYQFPFKN